MGINGVKILRMWCFVRVWYLGLRCVEGRKSRGCRASPAFGWIEIINLGVTISNVGVLPAVVFVLILVFHE